MRNIIDILIFKTPFEDKEVFLSKFKKIEEMFVDYMVNANMPLPCEQKESQLFTDKIFWGETFWIQIVFSYLNDIDTIHYFPSLMVSYSLNEIKFQKENMEMFFNDNIKFIFNVFFEQFFIEYDAIYKINDINKWKKLDMNNLKKFDLQDKYSKINKNLLDSMMYLYYTCVKNIHSINENRSMIEQLHQSKDPFHIAQQKMFDMRTDEKQNILIKQAENLKNQIDAFITLIS